MNSRIPLPMRTPTVPRHVVRCVSKSFSRDRSGRLRNWANSTRGWQVRYAFGKKRSKFFSDGVYGGKAAALERAIEYLRSIYRGGRPGLRNGEAAGKRWRTGHAGVRLVFEAKKRRTGRRAQFFVEVGAIPSLSTGPRRWYIGTDKTATQAAYERVLPQALAHRAALVRRLKAYRRRYPRRPQARHA